MPLVNRCTTGRRQKAIARRPAGSDKVTLSGTLKRRVTVEVAVRDPGLFFAGACRTALAAKGIRIDGQTRRARVYAADGTLPADVQILAEHRTPLATVLRRCNKNSQNLFAESLLKTLGRSGGRGVGTWPAGQEAVRDFLRQAGLNIEGVVVDDGSGLSRQNRVTARLMTELLAHMHGQPCRQMFIESLSVSGQDGTLRRRLDGPFEGCLLGKTGYLRGARTLSGYVVNQQGHWLAVSLLVNDCPANSRPFTRLQDDICRLLVQADLPLPDEQGESN